MASEVSESEAEHVLVVCATHSKESLELYCKDHELALCRLCKVLKHKKCNVKTITDVFQNIDVSEAVKEASTQITTLGQAVISSKMEMQSLLDKIIEEKHETEEIIENIRNGLNGVLDRYKDQLHSQIVSGTETLTETIQTYESLSEQLENQKATLENAEGKGIQDIVSLIEAKNMYRDYQHVTDEMDKEIKEATICIKEDEMLPDLIQRLKSICQKKITESEEFVDGMCDTQQQDRSFISIKSCTPLQDSDIKLPDDSKVPNITGCCFLPDDRVIICDHANMRVKVLDKEMNIKFTIPCTEHPRDVACFDEHRIVVLYGLDNSFQFVCIKPGIILQQKRSTKLTCYGLQSVNRFIYISCYDFERKCRGIAQFVWEGWLHNFIPCVGADLQNLGLYLTLNSTGVSIFYVGHGTNCRFINKMSSSGHGIYSVCTTALKAPKSIICDSAGNLLICDSETKSIYLIDSDGEVGNTLLTEKDDFGPTSMCISARKDMLLVASSHKDASKITVYKIDYE